METIRPASATVQQVSAPRPARLESVDLLRGLVMVLMALDHTRDFLSSAFAFEPTDLQHTTPALFLTRWVTHYCAPIFMFLAGTGAYLSRGRGKTTAELSRFLWTRGLWLVLLELTVVRCLGWQFNVDFRFIGYAAVIWVLGWSMVVLAGLVVLPIRIVAGFGIGMILLHNLMDFVAPASFGGLGWCWEFLHQPGWIDFGHGIRFKISYPLVPWIGVMAVGYACGAVLQREQAHRRAWLAKLGLGLTLAFVALRATNFYGDEHGWHAQHSPWFTAFSFVNCTKYPPSLLYLLMTLGPGLIVLAWFDGKLSRWARPLLVFGRVPLFYYLLHLPLIHGLAVLLAWLRGQPTQWLFDNPALVPSGPQPEPPGYGFSLPVVYLVWLGVVLVLYPVCRWFAGVKQRNRSPWLSYL